MRGPAAARPGPAARWRLAAARRRLVGLGAQLVDQTAPAGALAGPELVAVDLPALADLGAEGAGVEHELDVDGADARLGADGDAAPEVVEREAGQVRGGHEQVQQPELGAGNAAGGQARGVGRAVAERALDFDELDVELADALVGVGEELARDHDGAAVLAAEMEQHDSDHDEHEQELEHHSIKALHGVL